ncbi:MAG: hypothetical protein Q8P46_01255 [Hyphomicrobiales bacterium]|nr:hypothetical protein [Hyphomicrobiales bacterium]
MLISARDRQHLLLAAAELIAEIVPPLRKLREQLVCALDRPGSFPPRGLGGPPKPKARAIAASVHCKRIE